MNSIIAAPHQQGALEVGGYNYIHDAETGQTLAVDKDTGEALPTTLFCVPVGSGIVTPQNERRNAERKRRCGAYSEGIARAEKLGKFNFVSIDANFSALSPADLAKLIYLSTYLEYGSGDLCSRSKRRLTANDLPNKLGISRAQANRFLYASKSYLIIDEDGYLSLDNRTFIFGALRQNSDRAIYQKLYRDSVRKLYKATPVSKHKQLGYVFQMLPYINKEYNILCSNIYETELSEIDAMTVSEFCEIIGYSKANASRLVKEYSKITFPVEGRQEHFCAFVYSGGSANDMRIYVNPHILYNGSNAHLIEILSVFCAKN